MSDCDAGSPDADPVKQASAEDPHPKASSSSGEPARGSEGAEVKAEAETVQSTGSRVLLANAEAKPEAQTAQPLLKARADSEAVQSTAASGTDAQLLADLEVLFTKHHSHLLHSIRSTLCQQLQGLVPNSSQASSASKILAHLPPEIPASSSSSARPASLSAAQRAEDQDKEELLIPWQDEKNGDSPQKESCSGLPGSLADDGFAAEIVEDGENKNSADEREWDDDRYENQNDCDKAVEEAEEQERSAKAKRKLRRANFNQIIPDVLEEKERSSVEQTGRNVQKKIILQKARTATVIKFQEENTSCRARLQGRVKQCVTSHYFEVASATLILSNAFFTGIEAQIRSQSPTRDSEVVLFGFNMSFCFLLTSELVLKMIGYGKRFFGAHVWAWHLFDLILVVLGLADAGLAIAFANDSQTNLAVLRIVRLVKLARIMRVIRAVRVLRGLRMLMFAVMYTTRSLLWVLILLFLVLWIFGIMFTDMVPPTDRSPRLVKYYGSFWTTMFTLFKTLCGGIDWQDAVEPLSDLEDGPAYTCLFIFYVSISTFAILNVINGVFVHSALESAYIDQDLVIHDMLMHKSEHEKQLQGIWKKLDVNADIGLTLQQFEAGMNDESVAVYMNSLGIRTVDAFTLFQLLEDPETHMVQLDDFVEGCLSIQGAAKAVDIACLRREMKRMNDRIMESFNDLVQKSGSHETTG